MNQQSGGLDPNRMVRDFLSGPSSSGSLSSGDSLSLTLGNAIQIIKENYRLIIVFLILGIIAGIVKALSETPVYQAGLTMVVEPSSAAYSRQGVFDPYAFRFYETQYELLKSRSVAERVVDKLKLVERDSLDSLLVAPSFATALFNEIEKVTGYRFTRVAPVYNKAKPLTESEALRKKSWLTGVIQSGVGVSGGEKTNLVRVSYKSINPDFAAEVANALVEAYIEEGLDSQLNRSQQTAQWFAQRIDDLKAKLDGSQEQLQEFLVQEGRLNSSRSDQITTNELQALNDVYIRARTKLTELSKRYGARHPKITEAKSEVDAARSRLNNKSKNISSSREKDIELDRLERNVESDQQYYQAFLEKFKEADLSASGSQVTGARIVDKALRPGGSIYPQKQKIIMLWGFCGLFLGIGLAFLREQLDSTFKSGRIVEEKLGLPLFGVVQALPRETAEVERHYLENKRSVFSESINHIRTGVIYSDVDNPPKVIVVTSSVQSEGKTTLASNLAISYAQLGSTLLLDADLRRPRIKHIVESESSVGLVDCVAGAAKLGDCVHKDKEEHNLSIMNSGTTPPNPLELLASERFTAIIKALREKYEYVVVDTAPVLPASDAVVLGQLCDALLLVVQSDRTTHHMARDAIKRLNASRVSVAGLVLTQANIKKGNPYQYGGFYGYGAYAYVDEQGKN